MSKYTQLALTWLRGIDPALPVALLIVTVLLLVYSIRRWKPTWWLWVESTVPFVDNLDTGPMLNALWAAWQAWPAVVLGSALSALAAGASVRHALWGALCGAISAVVHVIMSNYKGLVGVAKPPAGPPTLQELRAESVPDDDLKPPSFPPPRAAIGRSAAAGLLLTCLTLGGCGLAAVVGPYLAEAAVLIADAVNAVDAAQALLPSLHLPESEQAKADAAIAKCRLALQAAATADRGATDLTAEQLDASLAAFRAAWINIQVLFASPHIGATAPAYMLPMPLAVKRAER